MTEKEKKAINNLKEIIELVEEELKNNNKNTNAVLDIIDLKSLDTVLNLVNKQSNILNKIQKYAKGMNDKELLLILKSNEIDELMNRYKKEE